jgi:1-phosphofructokinase
VARTNAAPTSAKPQVAVLAPSMLLTVTVEDGGEFPEVHFHAGGQGFWVARMAAALGARVALATALGGESGAVLRSLLDIERVALHAVASAGDNGVYVHDRRSGVRVPIAHVPAPHLRRHELDALYGAALGDALEAGVACLTGPEHDDVLEPEVYTRLAGDLRRNDVVVVADLTGPSLVAALDGGVDVLKLSDGELVDGGWASDDGAAALAAALVALHARGAAVVIASRGPKPAIVFAGGGFHRVSGPRLHAVDPSGAGDAMLAAIAVSLAGGRTTDVMDAIVFGAAAGAVNAIRHGLGSGALRQVEQLVKHVRVEPLGDDEPGPAAARSPRPRGGR